MPQSLVHSRYKQRRSIDTLCEGQQKFPDVLVLSTGFLWRIIRLRLEERPPIWKVAPIILNKQPTRGGPPALGLGEMLTTPRHKNLSTAWTDPLVLHKQRNKT